MSMPSSRLLVATTQGAALLESSSMRRCSSTTDPWWARASSGAAPTRTGLRHTWAGEAVRRTAVGSEASSSISLTLRGAAPRACGVRENDRRRCGSDQFDDSRFD